MAKNRETKILTKESDEMHSQIREVFKNPRSLTLKEVAKLKIIKTETRLSTKTMKETIQGVIKIKKNSTAKGNSNHRNQRMAVAAAQ